MARFFPDKIKLTAQRGEKRVFRAVLRWTSFGAARVVLDGRTVAASGTEVLFPVASQVHHLLVYRLNGAVAATEARVIVHDRQPRAVQRQGLSR